MSPGPSFAYTRNLSVAPSPSRPPSAVPTHPEPAGTPSTGPDGQGSPLSKSSETGEGEAFGLAEAVRADVAVPPDAGGVPGPAPPPEHAARAAARGIAAAVR